jgi:hypothetical protein
MRNDFDPLVNAAARIANRQRFLRAVSHLLLTAADDLRDTLAELDTVRGAIPPQMWDAPDGCAHGEPVADTVRAPEPTLPAARELAPDLTQAPTPEPTPAPDAPPPPIDPPALAPAPRGRGKAKGQPQPEPTPAPTTRRDPSELLARMAPAAPAVPPAEAPPGFDADLEADDFPPL